MVHRTEGLQLLAGLEREITEQAHGEHRTNDDLRRASHAIDNANAFVFSGELASTEMMMPIASNQEHQDDSMLNFLLDDVFPEVSGANARTEAQASQRPDVARKTATDNARVTPGGRRVCSVPNCLSHALKGDKCCKHGGGQRCSYQDCNSIAIFDNKCALHGRKRECSHPDCTRRALAKKDTCRVHGGGRGCEVLGGRDHEEAQDLRRSGEKTEVRLAAGRCSRRGCRRRARLNSKCTANGGSLKCSIPDCINLVVTRGKCGAHGGGSRCSEPGCTKRAHLKHKCTAHGERIPCSQEGCTRRAVSRGTCRLHRAGKECSHTDCSEPIHARGLCYRPEARGAFEGCPPRAETKSCLRPEEVLKVKGSERFDLAVLTRIAQQKIKE